MTKYILLVLSLTAVVSLAAVASAHEGEVGSEISSSPKASASSETKREKASSSPRLKIDDKKRSSSSPTTSATAGEKSRTEKLSAKGVKELDRRIKNLTKLIERITSFKRLSAATKSELTTQVQAEITSLTALKAKIQATTDPTELKSLVESIKSSYRIYALFMPKVEALSAAERLQESSSLMSTVVTKLEQRVATAKTAGQNVSTLESSLTSMKTNLTSINQRLELLIGTLNGLTPEGFPENRSVVIAARQELTEIHKILNTVHKEGKAAITEIKKLGTSVPSSSASASSSPIATLIPATLESGTTP